MYTMLNLRQFSRPNPSDANLHQRGEPLGMTNHGNSTYYHNTHKRISNGTNNIFNHLYATEGNMGQLLAKTGIMTRGGIVSLREPKNLPKSNNPMFNALVNAPQYPRISKLVDSRLTAPNPLIQPPNSSI